MANKLYDVIISIGFFVRKSTDDGDLTLPLKNIEILVKDEVFDHTLSRDIYLSLQETIGHPLPYLKTAYFTSYESKPRAEEPTYDTDAYNEWWFLNGGYIERDWIVQNNPPLQILYNFAADINQLGKPLSTQNAIDVDIPFIGHAYHNIIPLENDITANLTIGEDFVFDPFINFETTGNEIINPNYNIRKYYGSNLYGSLNNIGSDFIQSIYNNRKGIGINGQNLTILSNKITVPIVYENAIYIGSGTPIANNPIAPPTTPPVFATGAVITENPSFDLTGIPIATNAETVNTFPIQPPGPYNVGSPEPNPTHITRDYLVEILNYTYDICAFPLMKFYHKKEKVIRIFPDRRAVVSAVNPDTNRLKLLFWIEPWIELGMPVRFENTPDSALALDQATLDANKTYYITGIFGGYHCYEVTIGTTPSPADIIDLPFCDFLFSIVQDRSFLEVTDTSWMYPGMRVLLELLPSAPEAINNIAEISENTRYYIKEIFDNNIIRISYSPTDNFIHFLGDFATPWDDSSIEIEPFEIVQDNTFIESLSEDQIITFLGTTNYKIPKFEGEFGLEELDKLYYKFELTAEYPADPNINIVYDAVDDEKIASRLVFKNVSFTYEDEHDLLPPSEINEKLQITDYEGSLWNFAFTPNQTAITRLNYMAKTYNALLYMDVFTTQITNSPSIPNLSRYQLEFEFGEKQPYFGKFLFESEIIGTYIPQVIYQYETKVNKVTSDYRAIIRGIEEKYEWIITDVYPEVWYLKTEDTTNLFTGMEVRFINPPDSANALNEATLDPTKKYYIRELADCNLFTISETPFGPTLELPFCDFEFIMIRDLHGLKMEITIPDTYNYTYSTIEHDTSWFKQDIPIKFYAPNDNALPSYARDANLFLEDSANALIEAGLSAEKTYYVKEIYSTNVTRNNADDANVYTTIFSISDSIQGDIIEFEHTDFSWIVAHENIGTFEIEDTRWFNINDPIRFSNISGNINNLGINTSTTYYIKEIINNTTFTISENIGADKVIISPLIEIDFVFSILRADNTGILFTSYPAQESELKGAKVLNTVYGNQYPKIANKTTYEFKYGESDSQTPLEETLFGPLRINDDNQDPYYKIYNDITVSNSNLDTENVHTFRYKTDYLQTRFPSVGDEVKIYDPDKKGYLMPVGFLRERWTYTLPQILAILSDIDDTANGIRLRNSTKTIRFSDQGNCMITLNGSYGTYNYIIPAKK